VPGPEGSIGKLWSAIQNQRITAFAVELLGPGGMLQPGGYHFERPAVVDHWQDPPHAFLRAVANTIEGGTTEIAKNIIAERVLGLPAEPRDDRATLWKELSRS
jgi:alkylation response protein AidB-like acyl-CoA dehydrogenase